MHRLFLVCEAYHIEIWKGSFGDYALYLERFRRTREEIMDFILCFV